MNKLHSKWVLASVLTAALVAGCGGDSSTSSGGSAGPTNPATSAQGVVDYILSLIASNTSDVAEPVDIAPVTLATDETAEPSPI